MKYCVIVKYVYSWQGLLESQNRLKKKKKKEKMKTLTVGFMLLFKSLQLSQMLQHTPVTPIFICMSFINTLITNFNIF